MPSFGQLFVSISADTSSLQKALNGAETDLKKVSRSFGKLGADFTAIGSKLTVGLTAPILGAGAVSAKFAADFDQAMTQSIAIMDDVSDALRTKMADAARQMAKETTFSAAQAAESFFFLASAGLGAEASIAALPKVAKFAQAGMFDMALATDLLTDAQSALGLTIRDDAVANMENMARVSDVLVKANTLANASVQQFSEALTNKAGAALRAVGKDVEEGVAVLAAFADQGIKGAEAGTQFGIVLRDLQTKAIDNKKEFAELGVSVFDSAGEMLNLGDIVANLEQVLGGMSDEGKRSALALLGFSDKSVAATQALLGTSEAIKKYEKDLKDAAGTTDDVAAKQLTSFQSKLSLLKSRFEDVAIGLGIALIPALERLIDISEPVLRGIEGLAKAFGDLDPTLQLATFGIAGLAAAIGPALLVAGQLAFAVQNLIFLFPSIGTAMAAASAQATAMGGAMAIGKTAVLGLGEAALVAGAAFAGWKLGEWAAENIPLVQKLGDIIVAFPLALFEDRITGVRDAQQNLGNDLRALSADLANQGIVVERGSMTLLEWGRALREAAKDAYIHKTRIDELVGPIQEVGNASRKSGGQVSEFSKAVSEAVDKLEEQAKQAEVNAKAAEIYQRRHSDSTREFNNAIDAVIRGLEDQEKQERINAIAAQEYAVSHDSASDALRRTVFDVNAYIEKLKEQDAQSKKSAEEQGKLAEAISKSVVPALDKAQVASAALVIEMTKNVPAIEGASGGFHSLEEAIAGFGIKSQSVARGELEVLRQQLEVIRKQAAEGNPDALAALSEAQRKYDEAVKASIGGTNEWSEALKQVSTIITDFAKNVSEKFISVLTGGDRRAFNRALEEQAEELKQKLDEATSDLEMSLADRESVYRDYVMEVADAEQEIRDNSARRLSEELEDLQESLAKKTESYQRFVEDVNTTLSRKRSDFTDDISDEKKRTAQTIAERRKRNARDIADAKKTLDRKTRDIEAQIREELAKGAKADHDRIAALRRRLADEQEDFRITQQRKLEDLNAFIAQEQAALAEFEEEKRQKLARETEDIQKDLERREQDYAAYVDEINAKATEITEKIRTEEQAKLAALQESLAKQTAEYEKFKTDTLAKYEETKTGINAKLDELAEKHRSVTDDIKGLFSTAFTEAGTAVTRFVAEVITNKLIRELSGLIDDILPAVGKAFKAIFGIGGEASDAISHSIKKLGELTSGAGGGDTSGGRPGGGGGTATPSPGGGLLGVIGAVTDVVNAIANVITAIYSIRQEGTLNAIELNTRKTSRVLEGDRGPGDLGIIGALFSISDILQFGTFVKVLEQIRDRVSGGLSVTGGEAPDIGFLVGNTDEMKTTLWDIRSLLRSGIAVAGMAAVMTGTAVTAENTAVTASNTQAVAVNTAPRPMRGIRGRTRIGETEEGDIPSGLRGRTRTGFELPGQRPPLTGAELEELQRRNPLAFGSDNPLASLLLGGRDPKAFGADIGAGIDLSGLEAEFEAAQQTANNQLDELHNQTVQLQSLQDAIEAQGPQITINIQNAFAGSPQEFARLVSKEIEKQLRTSTRGIR